MRPLGYSTGAIARGDIHRSIAVLARMGSTPPPSAIEVSALRFDELKPLVAGFRTFALERYEHVAVHLPSRFARTEETEVLRLAKALAEQGCPRLVAHPDTFTNLVGWAGLGSLLLVENMDKRKPCGRTLVELEAILEQVPEAGICFDVGHARQVDPSLVETVRMLNGLRRRIGWLHLSEVSSSSRHERMSYTALRSLEAITPLLPPDAPAVIESPVREDECTAEYHTLVDILAASSVPATAAIT